MCIRLGNEAEGGVGTLIDVKNALLIVLTIIQHIYLYIVLALVREVRHRPGYTTRESPLDF